MVNCENTAINLSGNVGRLDHKPPLKHLDYTTKSILSPTDSSFSKEPIAVSLMLY